MQISFLRLNNGWNAEPNSPVPLVEVHGEDLVLSFYVNAFQYPEFEEEEAAILRFVRCARYRLGPTNDEGWHRGQCRFSKLAPSWGEFYLVRGDDTLIDVPQDWKAVGAPSGQRQHFLFYFRDSTFECVAERCQIEPVGSNSLQRTGKELRSAPPFSSTLNDSFLASYQDPAIDGSGSTPEIPSRPPLQAPDT